MELLQLMENFTGILRNAKVKEVQVKMLEFYIKEYLRKQQREETIGDMLGSDFEDLKKDTSELLNIINIQIQVGNKTYHCNDLFQKLLEKIIEKEMI